jgi:hypothetical protein
VSASFSLDIMSDLQLHRGCSDVDYTPGVVLLLEPNLVGLDWSSATRKGELIACWVRVFHDGTRQGYRMAWSVARRLIRSSRACPALVTQAEHAALSFEIGGRPCYIVVQDFSRDSLTFASLP